MTLQGPGTVAGYLTCIKFMPCLLETHTMGYMTQAGSMEYLPWSLLATRNSCSILKKTQCTKTDQDSALLTEIRVLEPWGLSRGQS